MSSEPVHNENDTFLFQINMIECGHSYMRHYIMASAISHKKCSQIFLSTVLNIITNISSNRHLQLANLILTSS